MYARPFAPKLLANSVIVSSWPCANSRRLWHVIALTCAAVRDGAAEHFELGARAKSLSEIHKFHAETRVGFVDAVASHRFCISHARERRRHSMSTQLSKIRFSSAFDQRLNRSSRSMKLISMSSCVNSGWRSARRSSSRKQWAIWKYLSIAGDHEDLFELLRRLRQRVKLCRGSCGEARCNRARLRAWT